MSSWIFANPTGLWALLSLPTILAIHLFRQRFRKRVVAGLFLWQDARQVAPAGRRIDTLYRSRSLWFELAAAALLSLLIAGPRYVTVQQGRHLVAVLDQSVSMSAVDDDGHSFLEVARKELRKRMADFDRISLIATAPRPLLIAGPAASLDAANIALQQWRAYLPSHDKSAAFRLAQQVGGGSAQIIYVTDNVKTTEAIPIDVEIMSVGKAMGNVAILGARRTQDREKGGSRIFFRLANFSKQPAHVVVKLWQDENLLMEKSLNLSAGAENNISFPGPSSESILKLQISDDALAVDNEAWLPLEATRRVDVFNHLPEGLQREMVNRALKSVPFTQLAVEPGDAHLHIRATGQDTDFRQWEFQLGPMPADVATGQTLTLQNFAGPYIVESSHPMMESVLMDGVIWGGAGDVVPEGAESLISSGTTPLLASLPAAGTQRFWLNITLARSNLFKSPTWPLLFANLVELRRDHFPGLSRLSFRCGEPVEATLAEGVRGKSLRYRNRNEDKWNAVRVVAGPSKFPPIYEAGIYEFMLEDEPFAVCAVNFEDASESNLLHVESGIREAAEDPEFAFMMQHSSTLPWAIVCLLAFGMLLLHWHLLIREPYS